MNCLGIKDLTVRTEPYCLVCFQVEYFFDPDCEECELFSVDSSSGEIRLITALVDGKDTYTLLVNARDGDSSMAADQRNEAPSE